MQAAGAAVNIRVERLGLAERAVAARAVQDRALRLLELQIPAAAAAAVGHQLQLLVTEATVVRAL
jgi:hypothetical protein